MWPLSVYWSCFDVRCQAILDLEGALEITNSTCIPRVLALCHPLGMEMIWTMVPALKVECRLVGIKFDDIYIPIYMYICIYALQFMNNNKAKLSQEAFILTVGRNFDIIFKFFFNL